jgi:organic hydroperoxide reductase OsmC/OhrA
MISQLMNQTNENIVNGVSVDKLFGIMDTIKTNSDIAKFNLRAKGNWISGAHTQTIVKDFYGSGQTHSRKETFVLEKDEPSVLLGTDTGANPGEYALAVLNGCLTSALVYHAAAKGIQIDEIETILNGDVDLRGYFGNV